MSHVDCAAALDSAPPWYDRLTLEDINKNQLPAVEGMARQVEAEGLLLAGKPLPLVPLGEVRVILLGGRPFASATACRDPW